MKNLFVLVLMIFSGVTGFAQVQSEIKSQDINEAMEEAFKQLEGAMDTLDFSQLFSSEMMQGFDSSILEGFSFGSLDSLLSSDDLEMFFGGESLEEMLGESMKMLEGIDMKEMEKMMQGIDMESLEKMFEGMDMEAFGQMFEGMDLKEFEGKPSEKKEGSKDKKVKKI